MSFYFPKQNLYITVPYKNGATSALNFFVSIENYLEANQTLLKQLDHLGDLRIEHDLGVHNKSGSYSADKYRKLATKSNMLRADLRLFILRDPYERFASCWNSHIYGGVDPFFTNEFSRIANKYDLNSVDELQIAILDFQNRLSRKFYRLILNGHMWPQTNSMYGKNYDLIYDTKTLKTLPRNLGNASNKFRAFADLEVPELNVSNLQYSWAWNQDMRKILNKIYSTDFLLYDNFTTLGCDSPIQFLENYKKLLMTFQNFKSL